MYNTIADLACGDRAAIIRLGKGGDGHYRQKLLALGLLPGTELEIKRIAPFGDPVEISVRGFALTLRKKEADLMVLKKL